MDLHPTPFPGKHRPTANAANPAKKPDRDRTKPSLQTAAARPKRTFGTARNSNIPVEKPQPKPVPTKPCKPWKPSGNATQKSTNDTKIGPKKTHHVCFQEPRKKETESAEKRDEDEVESTPISLVNSTVVGTPYHTAENCSKCRFDKLETSAYWVSQIKVAGSGGKHFVSAAFFRLAFECQAQPFRSLRNELKHYVARHNYISSETIWSDLFQLYGLSNEAPCELEKLDAVLVEKDPSRQTVKSETVQDECFEFDIIENLLNISEKENTELFTDDFGTEDYVDVKAMPDSSIDSPCWKNGNLKFIENGVSGKNSDCKNNSKSKNIATQRSGSFLRRIVAQSKISQGGKILIQGKENKKGTSPSLSDNLNLNGAIEDAAAEQDEQVEELLKQLLPNGQ